MAAEERLATKGELAGEGERAERRLLMGERGREEGESKGVVLSLRAFGGEIGGGGDLLRSRCSKRGSAGVKRVIKKASSSPPLLQSSPSTDPPCSPQSLPALPVPTSHRTWSLPHRLQSSSSDWHSILTSRTLSSRPMLTKSMSSSRRPTFPPRRAARPWWARLKAWAWRRWREEIECTCACDAGQRREEERREMQKGGKRARRRMERQVRSLCSVRRIRSSALASS